ncbi:MAG: N-acetylmuramoyl-L-alanine amidase [Cetobacterium sp.]
MKIALVVGHNTKSKGAYSEGLKLSEYDLFKQVADKVAEHLKGVDVYTRKDTGSYSKEMSNLLTEIHKTKYDLVIELHFNAFNKVAEGVEVLYYSKSTKGKEWAEQINKIHNSLLGIKIRGLIPISDNSKNGSYGIMKCKYPYILTESFFGDNPKDTAKVTVESLVECFIIFLKSLGVLSQNLDVGNLTLESLDKRLKILEGKL